MNPVCTQKKYHGEILKVWEKGKSIADIDQNFNKIYQRGASVQDKLYEDTILFVGIGASYDEKTRKNKKEVDGVLYETKEVREEHRYYKAIDSLVKKTDYFENWSHIDITLLFETKQEKIKPFYRKHRDFMQAQFDLAVKMLKDISPKVIVVCNAFVRDLFKSPPKDTIKHDLQFTFDKEKLGTDLITAPVELKDTPVFFTSMLSGQRALDIGSRERLIWHIRYIKDKIPKR